MIYLNVSVDGLKTITKERSNYKDAQFILSNWENIPIEEAKRLNPWFFKRYKHLTENKYFFWKCLQHDPKTNLCKCRDNRPNICRNFPFYPEAENRGWLEIDGVKKLHPTYSLYSSKCIFLKNNRCSRDEWNKGEEKISKELLECNQCLNHE
jgi:hypothetical protein